MFECVVHATVNCIMIPRHLPHSWVSRTMCHNNLNALSSPTSSLTTTPPQQPQQHTTPSKQNTLPQPLPKPPLPNHIIIRTTPSNLFFFLNNPPPPEIYPLPPPDPLPIYLPLLRSTCPSYCLSALTPRRHHLLESLISQALPPIRHGFLRLWMYLDDQSVRPGSNRR